MDLAGALRRIKARDLARREAARRAALGLDMPANHADFPATVVVAEADAALLHALTFALQSAGYVVHGFQDAESALAGMPPDVACLVLSQRLPGMSGLDLHDRLRAREQAAPAILLASNPNKVVFARAAAQGVDVVEKPLLGAALEDAVRAAVKRRKQIA
jgi:two-component system, LuxR family, response regulator FixJ